MQGDLNSGSHDHGSRNEASYVEGSDKMVPAGAPAGAPLPEVDESRIAYLQFLESLPPSP